MTKPYVLYMHCNQSHLVPKYLSIDTVQLNTVLFRI